MNKIEKVLIIGAHGSIGQLLSKKLAEAGHYKPTAFIRKESQKDTFEKMGVRTMIANLEDTVENLKKQFTGFDCVVFTAGSGGSTGAEKKLSIDLDGAVKSMEAAEGADISRFIMVSASHSDDRDFWDKAEGMKPYYVAKHYADEMLRHSNLDYTILRPVMLTDDEGSGKIKASFNPSDMNKKIAREDVASVIAKVIGMPHSIGKTIEISSGETAVEDALGKVLEAELVS